ncbi:MAG TPA: ThuA domain-containing protein [Phycisphaerae bacterium]|nr:ThuA domain-containing protein [Phycisphaerae bacterium]
MGGALVVAAGWICLAEDAKSAKKRIIFYTESEGFRHSVVVRPLTGELSYAEKHLKDWAAKAGYDIEFSQSFHDLKDPKQFDRYDAIVMYTSGNPKFDQKAMFEWLRSGKALVGIHAATDTWRGQGEEFPQVIGAAFTTHGPTNKEKVTIKIEDQNHPATKMLGTEWVIADEIYQHDRFSRDRIHVLMSIDKEKTDLAAQKMVPEGDYPLAWTREEGKGRVFYTALGHREDVWTNATFERHLMAGMAWAMRLTDAK